jgi:hypothetical protein
MSRRRLRISQGPDFDPLHGPGSNSDPHLRHRGLSAWPSRRTPLRRRRQDPDQEPIVISPPRIEVCSDTHWQSAIDLLAELLAPAFERRPDDSKAA